MVSFHVLLLDRAGNNLVNADFSLYLGHIFTVKHIYLTLYIVYALRISPIYSVPPALPPPARVRVRACACVRACGCPRGCVGVCARVRGRCPPTFQSLAVHFIRL